MKKYLLTILVLTSACMQSRKGIKKEESAVILGELNMCDTYPRCELASTHLIASVNYSENYMEIGVDTLPTDLDFVELASDEKITYRLLAKRPGDGKWRRMPIYNIYEGTYEGLSENMRLEKGDYFKIIPPIGTITQYRFWILERVIQKGNNKVPYGLGTRLLDIEVGYSELDEEDDDE